MYKECFELELALAFAVDLCYCLFDLRDGALFDTLSGVLRHVPRYTPSTFFAIKLIVNFHTFSIHSPYDLVRFKSMRRYQCVHV